MADGPMRMRVLRAKSDEQLCGVLGMSKLTPEVQRLCGTSIVRLNLLTVPGYAPFCGNELCTRSCRTVFSPDAGQFCCQCGWQSDFSEEFIKAYRSYRIASQVCSKCGVTVAANKSKYCGDGSDKDNPHRWVRPVYP